MAAITDRRIAEWLAILTFATYAYCFAGGGWNQNSQLDLTRAIVERHTFAIDAYARNTGDVSYANGHIYSNKSPALSFLAAIPYAVLAPAPMPLSLKAYACSLATVALPGALIPAMLFLYGRRRGFPARWSAFVALATAFATQIFPYSTIFMVHVPSGALLLYAFTTPRRASGGFAAGLAAAMNYLCVPAVAVLAVIPSESGAPRRLAPARRDTVRFLAGAALPLVGLALYQQVCFGSFLTNSVAKTDPRFMTAGAKMGVLQAPSLAVFLAITISAYRGVFYFAPVLIPALGGLVVWWRAKVDRSGWIALVLISAVFFTFNLCFNGWDAGFSIGGRYLVPIVPLLGLALLHFRGKLTVALAVISFAINFTAAVVDPQPNGTIPRPLTQYLLPLLITGHFAPDVPITPPWSAETITGHTSVNPMTFDEPRVFETHPPGSLEAEWTSFNLGEPLTGAGSLASIVPLLLILAGGCAAILKKTA